MEDKFEKDLFNLHGYIAMNRKSLNPEGQNEKLNQIALAFKSKEEELTRARAEAIISFTNKKNLSHEVEKQKRWKKSAIWAWAYHIQCGRNLRDKCLLVALDYCFN